MSVLMALGPHLFLVSKRSFEGLERRKEAALAIMPRVGPMVRPGVQFTGIGEETVSITGTLYKQLGGEIAQEILFQTVGLPIPLPLISRRGFFYGLYAIKSVSHRESEPDGKGGPRKVEYTIDLTAWRP